jgi:hypothetical protein
MEDPPNHLLYIVLAVGFLFFILLARKCRDLCDLDPDGDMGTRVDSFSNHDSDHMSDISDQEAFEQARAFRVSNPPKDLTQTEMEEISGIIQSRGISVYRFEADPNSGILVHERCELTFNASSPNCVQSNFPFNRSKPVSYFEVKILSKPPGTRLFVGIATKPYPFWRFPGFAPHSAGYSPDTCKKYYSSVFGKKYGGMCGEGDVIGCGYNQESRSVFFTQNGRNWGTAFGGMKKSDYYPTIGADGPCILSINLGQLEYLYIEANIRRLALAGRETLEVPPAYHEIDHNSRDRLLASSRRSERPRPRAANDEAEELMPLLSKVAAPPLYEVVVDQDGPAAASPHTSRTLIEMVPSQSTSATTQPTTTSLLEMLSEEDNTNEYTTPTQTTPTLPRP